jgi:hypothetical protein
MDIIRHIKSKKWIIFSYLFLEALWIDPLNKWNDTEYVCTVPMYLFICGEAESLSTILMLYHSITYFTLFKLFVLC